MSEHKYRKKKKICILLILIILVLDAFLGTLSFALTTTETVVVSHERLDTGVVFIWSDGKGNWQNGLFPNGSADVDRSIDLGEGEFSNFKLTVYNGNNFSFSNKSTCHWNKTAKCNDKSSFNNNYMPYATVTKSVSGSYDEDSNDYDIEQTVTLRSTRVFDVADYVRQGKQQYVYDFLGDDPPKKITEPMNKMLTDPTVKGFLYFVPVVITYDETIEVPIIVPEVGDFEPDFSLPSSAEQFEHYTVADDTMVDSDCTIDYAVLEWHDGDGNWKPADTWDGTGKPGENTGGSITESCYTISTRWYRLTVYDTDGNVKSIIKTIKIVDDGSVSSELYVTPYLDADKFTYEGHPAYGRDESEFEVEKGEETFVYSPSQAYKRRLARNTFRILEDTPHVLKKKSDTLVEVVFEKKGFYNMELEVKPRNKDELYDTESIEVRKTPYIIDSLGGFQKENRKQTLSLNIAIHPDHPLTDLFVKIKDKATGEEVYLKPTQAQNSNTIKTRLMTSDKGKYFEKYELEFLTKNNKQKDYEYSVYAHDGKGGVDAVTKTFTVYPDLPPEPKIDLLESYLRTEKSNTAQIKAECKTVSKDGDQVKRTWWVASDTNHDGYYLDETYKSIHELGYIDESFGSKQKIKVNKNGVGKFKVKLFVKEVWTEPTLEEYVTDADRLTAMTYKASEVINIAPVVSAELMDATPVDVLLLTPEKDIQAAQSKMTTLDVAFKEKGIDANVNIHALHDVNPNALGEVFSLSQDSGYCDGSYGRSKRYINMLPEMDNQYVFRVANAGLRQEGQRFYSLGPYTLEAYDILSHAKVWRYTLTDAELIAAMGERITAASKSRNLIDIHLDKTEQYVYITSDQYNKTIVLKRDTGSFVTKLNFVVDGDIYVTDQAMFLFKSDCIEKYNLLNNTLTTFMDRGSSSTNFVDGKVHFITVDTNTQLFRGILDLNTQSIKKEYIHALQDTTHAYSSSYIPAGIDIQGNALMVQIEYKNEDEIYGFNMSIIDKDNRVIKEVNDGWHGIVSHYTTYKSYGLITNEKGIATHFYFSYGTESDWNFHYVYEIFGHNIASYAYHEKYEGSVIFGKHLESENKIILIKGCSFWRRSWAKALGVRTSNYTFYEGSDISLPRYTKQAVSSDKFLALIANKNMESNLENGQIIKGHRYHQTLEDVMERAVNQYAYFRDDAQKYVVIMEDLYHSDQSKMQDMMNKFKNKGIKVIYIGKNAVGNHHYSKIITQAVQGKSLNYSNIHENFNHIANTISSLKSRVKHFANLNFRQNDRVRLQKKLTLDPSSEYMYEYDIQYNKDMANKEVDVLSLHHEIKNVPHYGMMDSRHFGPIVSKGYLKDVVFEDFNGIGEHPLLTLDKGEHDLRHYPSNGFFGDHVNYGSKDGNLNFRMEEDGFVTFDFLSTTTYNRIYLDGKELFYAETPGKIPYILYLSKGEHTLYCRSYSKVDRYFTIDNFKIQYIKKNAGGTGTHIKQPVQNVKAGKVYHVKNTFTTPSEFAEMVNIPSGYKVVEHFNSWAITPYVTHYNSKIENGVLKSVDDRGRSEFSISVPENTVCKAKIRFKYKLRRKRYAGVTVSKHGGSTLYDETRKTITVNDDSLLYPGTYNVKVRYGTYEIDQLELQYFSHKVNDYENYFPSKEFTGNSTLDLWISGNKDDTVSLSNFKLYKVIDGKKYLVFESPCINQNTFQNLWHITKSWGTQINFDKKEQPEPEDPPLVYKKGELIAYNINYSDYENDPSKRQYWQYIHVPFNDGLHPEQGKILNAPIERSWVDGKYMVKHWQEDNTGAAAYDKLSNTEKMVFYIMGEAPAAPEVTYIKTHPSKVKEGQSYKIEIGVHDEDLDHLNTTIEVYKKNQLIYTYTKNNVSPTNGIYPPILSGNAPIAEVGKYTIVATAKDDTGVGMKSYSFTVVSEGKVEGEVQHTPQWNENRKKYNLSKTGNEEKPRDYNVFWSGEKFVLKSKTEGKPNRVHVKILDEGYETDLTPIDDKETWEGYIWDRSMIVEDNFVIIKWGRYQPETLTFRFTAYFSGGITKTHDVKIIVDNQDDYWQLHRKF